MHRKHYVVQNMTQRCIVKTADKAIITTTTTPQCMQYVTTQHRTCRSLFPHNAGRHQNTGTATQYVTTTRDVPLNTSPHHARCATRYVTTTQDEENRRSVDLLFCCGHDVDRFVYSCLHVHLPRLLPSSVLHQTCIQQCCNVRSD